MIYSAMIFAWISGPVYCLTGLFLLSTMKNGVCYIMVFKTEFSRLFYFFWHFASFYVLILLIFIFCYGRILLVVHRQVKIMTGHAAAPGSNHAHIPQSKAQTNVIKTMIVICAYYAVMWFPNQVSHLIMVMSANPNKFLISGYYVSLYFAFLYTCTNPFIYAIKFDPVKKILLSMMLCKKTNVVSGSSTGTHPGTG